MKTLQNIALRYILFQPNQTAFLIAYCIIKLSLTILFEYLKGTFKLIFTNNAFFNVIIDNLGKKEIPQQI